MRRQSHDKLHRLFCLACVSSYDRDSRTLPNIILFKSRLGNRPAGWRVRGATVNIKIYSVHIGTRLSHDVSKLRTDLHTTQTPRRRESSLILSGWNKNDSSSLSGDMQSKDLTTDVAFEGRKAVCFSQLEDSIMMDPERRMNSFQSYFMRNFYVHYLPGK